MKKRILTASGLASVAILLTTLLSGGASASATEQTAPPGCVAGVVATYTTQVNGREDSGLNGPWATDTFTRTTVVTTNCEGTYDLKISDQGSFTVIAGAKSPQNAVNLQASAFLKPGDFSGGATVTVKSDIPPINPGAVSNGKISTSEWAGLLFPGNNGDMTDWGWTYSYCGETWVNAKGGNSGDITGIECLTVPDYEVKLWGHDCKGNHPATATIEVKVRGSKWHEALLVDYQASDGQKGQLKVEPGETKAQVTLTFAEDAGKGKVLIKVPLAEKKVWVCTDCKPPATSTTSAPPASTTTATTPSAPPATTQVQGINHGGGSGGGPSPGIKDLAYTGAPGLTLLIALGALLVAVGGGALLFVLRRRTRPSLRRVLPMRFRHLLSVLLVMVVTVLTSANATAAPDDRVNLPSFTMPVQFHAAHAPVVNGSPAQIFPVTGHDAFPSLAQLPDGTVDLAYRHGGDHYVKRDGALMLSHADGAMGSFETATVFRDSPGVDERDPAISYINGELWSSWFTGSAALAAEGAWVQRGDQAPVRIDQLPYAAITSPVRALPDGSVGAVYYGRLYDANHPNYRDSAWFGRSTDGGATWSYRRFADGDQAGLDFQEPWLVVRGSQLIATFRYGSWDSIGISTSDDNGVTWSAPRRILTAATGRPNTLVLRSGTIVMSYRDTATHNGMVTSSRDDGATWSVPRVLFPAVPSNIGWAYGDFLEPQPGLILSVAAVENTDGTCALYRRWISESEFTNG